MPKESHLNKKLRAAKIVEVLNEVYPDQPTLLDWHGDPFKLVIAVSLSAQTTDAAVNKITPILWKKYPNAKSLSEASQKDVEKIIKPIGFYRNKAKNSINCANMIHNKFKDIVPSTMNELTSLPGVGRKTANVVMATAFKKCEGIAVDTHVFRITHLLNLSSADTPTKTEKELLTIFDKDAWISLNHQLVRFGRETCIARKPKCSKCPLCNLCPKKGL